MACWLRGFGIQLPVPFNTALRFLSFKCFLFGKQKDFRIACCFVRWGDPCFVLSSIMSWTLICRGITLSNGVVLLHAESNSRTVMLFFDVSTLLLSSWGFFSPKQTNEKKKCPCRCYIVVVIWHCHSDAGERDVCFQHNTCPPISCTFFPAWPGNWLFSHIILLCQKCLQTLLGEGPQEENLR